MAEPWHRWPPPLRSPDGELRLAIYARDGNVCRLGLPGCTRRPTVLDHIIHPKRGGAWFDPDNLRAACKRCNDRRVEGGPHQDAPEPTKPSRRW